MNSASPLSSSFVTSHRRPDMVVGPVVGSSSGSSVSSVTTSASPTSNNNLPNFREQAALQQQILQVSSGSHSSAYNVVVIVRILNETRKNSLNNFKWTHTHTQPDNVVQKRMPFSWHWLSRIEIVIKEHLRQLSVKKKEQAGPVNL